MSIEWVRKRAYQKGYLKHRNRKPEQRYKQMVNAVKSISETEGFSEIKEYWERERDMHSAELKECNKLRDAHHTAIVAERYTIADNFLSFLENLVEASE